jgi:NDP-sugar pyrophosphorylase family protein
VNETWSTPGSLADVPAVILAGGLGTRLRSVVADRPKVLAPIGGRPLLTYLFDQLIAAGIREAVLATGYRGEQIEAALGTAYGPLRLRYSPEPSPLGTGGALRLAWPLLAGPSALVMNGDSYCQADLAALRAWHCERRAAATLLLAQVPQAGRFGRVDIDALGRVVAFKEKSGGNEPGWINAGIYLVEREFLSSIPADRVVSLEKDVFPAWIGRGLLGYPCAGCRFLDIGVPESYAVAERFFQEFQGRS